MRGLLLLLLAAARGAAWAPAASVPAPTARRCAPRLAAAAAVDGGAAVSIEGLDVWAGSALLIQGVDWSIMPNERWALLGSNGCGKSTLLREIVAAAGGEQREDGGLKVSGSLQVGYLEQTAVSGAETSLKEEVMSRMSAYQSSKDELDAATDACASGSLAEAERLDAARAAFEAAGGYEVDARVSRVLRGLGFSPAEFERPCSSFSGGWQMRIGLARLLLSDPGLLLLDEPTNHLDAAARNWLGDYVAGYSGTVLVVSHDEPFVAAAAESIAEVSGGRIELYKSTSLGQFRTDRVERQQRLRSALESHEREAARLQEFIDRWGASATKARQAKDRQGKLEKLQLEMDAARALVVGPARRPKLVLAPPPACGEPPLRLRGASLRHAEGEKDILSGVDFRVGKRMRLLLRGPNGAGKSTILKALSGTLRPTAGEVEADDRLSLGVFAQDLAQELPRTEVACDHVAAAVRERDPTITDERCRTVMGALGLAGEKATRRISQLSGGEKARVALATFCLTPCNVLLLDEPTNHLDRESIAALLDAMDEYEGALVVVSHDRAFCEAIRATHVGYVADGAVSVEERDLRDSDFSTADSGVSNCDQGELARATAAAAARDPAARQAERDAMRERGRAPKKIAAVEKKIEEAEGRAEELDAQLLEAGSDVELAMRLSTERQALVATVEELYEEYERLSNLLV